MRRFVAVVVLVLVSIVHGVDPLFCPDGCTEAGGQESSAAMPDHDDTSACLLCQGGIVTGPRIAATKPANHGRAADAVCVGRCCTRPSEGIDHPPRAS